MLRASWLGQGSIILLVFRKTKGVLGIEPQIIRFKANAPTWYTTALVPVTKVFDSSSAKKKSILGSDRFKYLALGINLWLLSRINKYQRCYISITGVSPGDHVEWEVHSSTLRKVYEVHQFITRDKLALGTPVAAIQMAIKYGKRQECQQRKALSSLSGNSFDRVLCIPFAKSSYSMVSIFFIWLF